MKIRRLTIAILASASALIAQKGGIEKVLTSKIFTEGNAASTFNVLFSKPGPAVGDVAEATKWHIQVQSPDGIITTRNVTRVDTDLFASARMVTLHLDSPIDPKQLKSALFIFDAPLSSGVVQPNATDETGDFSAAKSKDNADVYISGSVNPAVGAKPTYSLDSQFNILWRGSDTSAGLGFSASVKTDNRPNIDPDSFRWKVRYRRPPLSRDGLGYDIAFAGMEFDRKANVINFVTAPGLDFIASRKEWNAKKAHPDDPNHTVAMFALDFKLAAEFGANLRNAYNAANSTLAGQGSGAIFRGVPAGSAYLVFNKPAGLQSIELESDYEVRLLARPELFEETRKANILSRGATDTDHPLPLLSRQARHHLANKISLNFSKALGISVQHEYGSLPPAFVYVDHKIQIGLVWKIKQNRALRF